MPGMRDCLSPVGDLQFAVDAGCVSFDRTRSDDELLSYLLVSSTQSQKMKYFQLALGERFNQTAIVGSIFWEDRSWLRLRIKVR